LLALISDLASNTTVIFLMQETQIYTYNKNKNTNGMQYTH